MVRSALAVTGLLLALPLAFAQEHSHEGDGAAVVLYDGPADGRAVVGSLTHLGFALLDPEGAPLTHLDAAFAVIQDGVVLFATNDTHEYDGLFSFDVRFTKPGPYVVEAVSEGLIAGRFEGEAVLPANATQASVEIVANSMPASRVVDFEIGIVGPDGAVLPHTDAIVELRSAADGTLVHRSHLHIHDAPIAFSAAVPMAGAYVAQVTGYEAAVSPRNPDVLPAYAEIEFTAGALGAPAAPAPDPAPPVDVLVQRGAVASADGLTLHAMYDPNREVGVGQLARIAGIVVDDATHAPKAHVDFAMTLSGPRGLLFSTENGHEYDGVFELMLRPDVPGFYDGTMTATVGETTLSVPLHLIVVPPVPIAGGVGPVDIAIDGLDDVVAGEPRSLRFTATGPGGPAGHSEVDVTIHQEGQPPLYQFKLHSHDSGETGATIVVPTEGEWLLRVDPAPSIPDAGLYRSVSAAFTVGPAAQVVLPLSTPEELEPATVPGAGAALGLAAVAAAALAAARRRA